VWEDCHGNPGRRAGWGTLIDSALGRQRETVPPGTGQMAVFVSAGGGKAGPAGCSVSSLCELWKSKWTSVNKTLEALQFIPCWCVHYE
jgi:hypothetical protein